MDFSSFDAELRMDGLIPVSHALEVANGRNQTLVEN